MQELFSIGNSNFPEVAKEGLFIRQKCNNGGVVPPTIKSPASSVNISEPIWVKGGAEDRSPATIWVPIILITVAVVVIYVVHAKEKKKQNKKHLQQR